MAFLTFIDLISSWQTLDGVTGKKAGPMFGCQLSVKTPRSQNLIYYLSEQDSFSHRSTSAWADFPFTCTFK